MTNPKQTVAAMFNDAQMAAAQDKLAGMLPMIASEARLIAKIRKQYYDAAIAEGFTAEQAMIICMRPGLS